MRLKCDAAEECERSADVNGEIFRKLLWEGNQSGELYRKIGEINVFLDMDDFADLARTVNRLIKN